MKKVTLGLLILLFLAITYMYLSTSLFLSVLEKNRPGQSTIESIEKEPEEFVGNANYKVKKITDRAGLFSVEIPSDWDVTILGSQLNRISGILAGVSKKSIKFGVIVSGEKRKISSRNEPISIIIDGLDAKYYTINTPGISRKKILAVEFLDENKYYFLSLTYNPKKYPEGKDVFENILSSFDILDVKEGVKINSINVISSDISPVQVNILVRGEFVDSCTEIGEIVEEQNNNIFSVNLYTKKIKNTNCILAPVLFEKTISLDTIGLNSGKYFVDVNGVSGEFNIPEK
jgi:hypothetical protein